MAAGSADDRSLAAQLVERIRRDGPIPVSEFVDAALYDPRDGFYMSGGRAGRSGDFLTAPEVGPLFVAVIARALDEDADLSGLAPYVPDSGEGRWTVQEAIDLDVPAPVMTLALLQRLQSREDDSFAHKLLSAMRHQFGGHAVKTAS